MKRRLIELDKMGVSARVSWPVGGALGAKRGSRQQGGAHRSLAGSGDGDRRVDCRARLSDAAAIAIAGHSSELWSLVERRRERA